MWGDKGIECLIKKEVEIFGCSGKGCEKKGDTKIPNLYSDKIKIFNENCKFPKESFDECPVPDYTFFNYSESKSENAENFEKCLEIGVDKKDKFKFVSWNETTKQCFLMLKGQKSIFCEEKGFELANTDDQSCPGYCEKVPNDTCSVENSKLRHFEKNFTNLNLLQCLDKAKEMESDFLSYDKTNRDCGISGSDTEKCKNEIFITINLNCVRELICTNDTGMYLFLQFFELLNHFFK